MAGLAAAYRLRRAGHQLTVFEAQRRHGMDAHAIQAEGGLVDVPLRVMSPARWPAVLQLADEAGVATFEVRTHTSCSWPNGQTWFRSGELPMVGWPFVGSWRYLNSHALRMACGSWQLWRLTQKLQQQPADVTLRAVLQQHHFDPLFWRGLILPILTTICTCDEKHLLNWPAAQLLSLLHSILYSSSLCRLQGGTTALVNALSQGLTLQSGSPVVQVKDLGQQIRVINEQGHGGEFDRVIVATQANQLGFLDNSQFSGERQMLAKVCFDAGELWVHQDTRFMPAKQQDWTALNFQLDRQLQKPVFTVWVNQIEPSLQGRAPVFQTWNPQCQPEPAKVLARIPMQRAVVGPATATVHAALQQWHQQPDRKLFYCGSWASEGVPLLESAVCSANAVVKAITRQV